MRGCLRVAATPKAILPLCRNSIEFRSRKLAVQTQNELMYNQLSQWSIADVVQRFFMKEPKQKAEELIADFIQMMPEGLYKIGYELKTQYQVAKCQAEYTAMTVKHSFKDGSKKHKYWLEVQNQIKLM